MVSCQVSVASYWLDSFFLVTNFFSATSKWQHCYKPIHVWYFLRIFLCKRNIGELGIMQLCENVSSMTIADHSLYEKYWWLSHKRGGWVLLLSTSPAATSSHRASLPFVQYHCCLKTESCVYKQLAQSCYMTGQISWICELLIFSSVP